MEKRTTIYDIADALGVSASTVSRVFNGKAGVKETTRQLILDTAKAMNYDPDVIARVENKQQTQEVDEREKRVSIHDVAKTLGLSVATVNRALTGKEWVKDETRQLVLDTAKKMNYIPNTLASSLRRGQIRLAVVAFTSFPEFHNEFLRGARETEQNLADHNVAIDYFVYNDGASNTPQADAFLETTIDKIAAARYNGALILAKETKNFCVLKEAGVYVATAVNDVDHALRDFCICYNAFSAGRMAAEMMYYLLRNKTLPVAIASCRKNEGIYSELVAGFEEQMRHTPLNLCEIIYNEDNEDVAYGETGRILREHPNMGAIYVNSFNYRGVVRAVQDAGKAGEVILITSDMCEELRNLITQGTVSASIFQNQYEQGKQGLMRMYQILAYGESTQLEELTAITPQLIMCSNVEAY